jgi:hypothetical protein
MTRGIHHNNIPDSTDNGDNNGCGAILGSAKYGKLPPVTVAVVDADNVDGAAPADDTKDPVNDDWMLFINDDDDDAAIVGIGVANTNDD